MFISLFWFNPIPPYPTYCFCFHLYPLLVESLFSDLITGLLKTSRLFHFYNNFMKALNPLNSSIAAKDLSKFMPISPYYYESINLEMKWTNLKHALFMNYALYTCFSIPLLWVLIFQSHSQLRKPTFEFLFLFRPAI